MLLALLGSLLLPPAHACLIVGPELHELDPAEVGVDESPPRPVEDLGAEVTRRGRGPDCDENGLCLSTSCDWVGEVRLEFDPAMDDRSPPELMGYRVSVVEGVMLDWVGTIDEDVRAPDGGLSLVWHDDDTHVQEPLDLTLGITPIDLAGNEGEMLTVAVTHPGAAWEEPEVRTGAAGCATTPLAVTLLGSLVSLAGALRTRWRAGQPDLKGRQCPPPCPTRAPGPTSSGHLRAPAIRPHP